MLKTMPPNDTSVITHLFYPTIYIDLGFPGDANGKEPACQCRRCKKCGFDP